MRERVFDSVNINDCKVGNIGPGAGGGGDQNESDTPRARRDFPRIMALNEHLGLFIVFLHQQILRFNMQFFCRDRSFFLRKRSGLIQDILRGDAGALKQGEQILRL